MDDTRSIRRQLGVTQTELADLLGLHQSTISRLESGSLPLDERTRLALEALVSRKSQAAAHHAAPVPAASASSPCDRRPELQLGEAAR